MERLERLDGLDGRALWARLDRRALMVYQDQQAYVDYLMGDHQDLKVHQAGLEPQGEQVRETSVRGTT